MMVLVVPVGFQLLPGKDPKSLNFDRCASRASGVSRGIDSVDSAGPVPEARQLYLEAAMQFLCGFAMTFQTTE